MTTSRTPLRIAAEREYALDPLELPPPSDPASTESLGSYPAIALFVERAKMTRGSFELTPENAEAVAAVCRRLDGLPLALELAAARLRLLAPEALLERLDHALQVLTSGARDVPERQQTLRATIDWSHSLLEDAEQRLFRRLAVFAGGCTFADVEAVCAEPGENILDELESLVDKALVQTDGQGDRLRMLQTIGEYARERLEAAGETREVALRHARRYAELAQTIRDGIEGTDQIGSLERGLAEEGNLQAALDTLLATAKDGDADACEAGLQMCGDLWLYWHIRGKNLTAREYATSFLAADTGGAPTVGRAGALITAGLASAMLGQIERANDEWAEAYRIAGECAADRELCIAAFFQGFGLLGIDPEAGLRRTTESVERSRALGFTWAEGFASSFDGILHAVTGDLDTAQTRYSEALEIQQRIGDEEGAGLSLGGLAGLASGRGDLAAALELYRQSLAAFEAIGDRAEEARILSEMAWTQLRHRRPCARAPDLLRLGAGLHRRGERPWSRALADRARSHRGGRGAARDGRADRRRGGGLRPPGGHRQRLLRRDAGAGVRRPGTSIALGRRRGERHRGRQQAHDRRSARPGQAPSDDRDLDRRRGSRSLGESESHCLQATFPHTRAREGSVTGYSFP